MLGMRQPSHPPKWSEWRAEHHVRWALPFHGLEWCFEWVAWALGNWALLEVLEYLGTFSVLIAVIFYFAESDKRTRMRHYTAWTVINTAQGKGGSGGRIEALEELNDDRVALTGLDASLADLRNADLRGVRWDGVASMRLANVFGVRNAPDGFVAFALAHGAVSAASDEEWTKMQN